MSILNYQQVSQIDEEKERSETVEAEPVQKVQNSKRYITFGVIGVILIFFGVLIPTTITREAHAPLWTSCGNSPTLARQRNCSFDLISFAWQTPECYDSSLVSEFASWDNWSFYTEFEGNVTVPQEVVLRGEQSVFASWHFHIVHCTFMWRQMQRAYENGWIDSHLRNYDHTLHCQKMLLLERIEHDGAFTNATVIYPTCQEIQREP